MAEVYDKETAISLLGHHALNSSGVNDIKLFPVYVQPLPKVFMIFGRYKDDDDAIPTPLCQGDFTP